MANFKGHLTFSAAVGAGYGGLAYFVGTSTVTSIFGGGLCCIGGLLPDLDHPKSRPMRESMVLLATIVAIIVFNSLSQVKEHPTETVVLFAVGVYFFVRYGLGHMLQLATVHRGMFHSLPAAIIAGEITLILASGTPSVRFFKAAAVMLGYLSHLLLDDWTTAMGSRSIWRLASPTRGCLKLFGPNMLGNLMCYALLAALTVFIIKSNLFVPPEVVSEG